VDEGARDLQQHWHQAQEFAALAPETDPLKQKLADFFDERSAVYETTCSRARQCKQQAAQLLKFFGADKSVEVEDLISSFRAFCRACRRVQDCIDSEAAAAASAAAASASVAAGTSAAPKSVEPVSRKFKHDSSNLVKASMQPPKQTPHLATQPEAALSVEVYEVPGCTPRPLVFDIPESDLPPLPQLTAPQLFPASSGHTVAVMETDCTGSWLQVSLRASVGCLVATEYWLFCCIRPLTFCL
jgi:hypothetical protein